MDWYKRILTPDDHRSPLPGRVLKLVKTFGTNLKTLLREGDTKNLEGFLGGLFSLMGVCQIHPRALLWVFLLACGVTMIVGAVNNAYALRLRGSEGAAVLWFVLTASLWSAPSVDSGRFVAAFLALSLSWICYRLGGERPTPVKETKVDNGRRGSGGKLDSGRHCGAFESAGH